MLAEEKNMTMIHDSGMAEAFRKRVQSLRPDSERKWGQMTVDQMLCHVNLPLAEALGEYMGARSVFGVPRPLFRWLVLNLPWGKSPPTRPDLVVSERKDFAKEHARCLELLGRFAALPLDREWPPSPNFGAMTGKHWSTLEAKHLDHHLRQFGA